METGDSKRWLPGFIALGVIWGSSFLFIKVGLESLTPVGVAFWRGVFGGITLLFLCVISKTGLPRKIKEWGHLTVVAFLLNSAPGFLFAYGETKVSSVLAGLLNATTPIMTMIVVLIAFRDQKITRDQIAGLVVGFAGICLIAGIFDGVYIHNWSGVGALLLATFCYGIAFPYSRRYISPLAYSSTALAAAQVTCSVLILSPVAFFSGTSHGPWTTKSLMAMLILGALGTGVAYILNFSNVKLAGSAIASTVTYITPVVATILGIGFLGETFKFSHLLGGILVLISAALVQGRIKIFSRR